MDTLTAITPTLSTPRLPSTSPLVKTDRLDGGARARAIDRGFQRGSLVRLARGVYCSTEQWLSVPPWDRHLLNAVAVCLAARRPLVLAGATALAVHGIPLVSTPSTITFRAATRHAVRRRARVSPYGRRAGAEAIRRTLAARRRAPRRLPDLPAVQGLASPFKDLDRPAEQVEATLSDGTPVATVLVDSAATALAEVMTTGDLALSVPPLDGHLRTTGQSALAQMTSLRDQLTSRAQQLRFDDALSLGDPRPENGGESLSRVVIHQLGFELPQPQVEISDAAGRFIARVDGLWRSTGLVGEFDGLAKYSGTYAGSSPPMETVIAEKHREDALRRAGHDVARWTWADLRTPARLERTLVQHGAPRRPADERARPSHRRPRASTVSGTGDSMVS